MAVFRVSVGALTLLLVFNGVRKLVPVGTPCLTTGSKCGVNHNQSRSPKSMVALNLSTV